SGASEPKSRLHRPSVKPVCPSLSRLCPSLRPATQRHLLPPPQTVWFRPSAPPRPALSAAGCSADDAILCRGHCAPRCSSKSSTIAACLTCSDRSYAAGSHERKTHPPVPSLRKLVPAVPGTSSLVPCPRRLGRRSANDPLSPSCVSRESPAGSRSPL